MRYEELNACLQSGHVARFAEHVLFDAGEGGEAGASGGRDREVCGV